MCDDQGIKVRSGRIEAKFGGVEESQRSDHGDRSSSEPAFPQFYTKEKCLAWTSCFAMVNKSSRNAEMPVRRRERGGEEGEWGRATIASVLGIKPEIERAQEETTRIQHD